MTPAFDGPAVVIGVGNALLRDDGVGVRVVEELRAVVAAHPFGADTSRTYVTFLAAEPDREAVAALAALDTGSDEAEVAGRDVYVRYPAGVQGARLTGARLERVLGVPGTARNWRTVTRLAELAAELDR